MEQVIILSYFSSSAQSPPSRLEYLPGMVKDLGCSFSYAAPEDFYEEDGFLYAKAFSPVLSSDQWQEVTAKVIGVYNRYPRTRNPNAFASVFELCQQHNIPFGNSPGMQGFVWDKVQTTSFLSSHGIQTPSVVSLERVLSSEHSCYYIKPIKGAFGEGIYFVQKVGKEFHLTGPTKLDRRVLQQEDFLLWFSQLSQYFIQKAVISGVPGIRSMSIRSFVQKRADGWESLPRVARVSTDDWVANAGRGATPMPLDDFLLDFFPRHKRTEICEGLDFLDARCAQLIESCALQEESSCLLELGNDYVLDEEGKVYFLEANGFPQGKLYYLYKTAPERYYKAYVQAHIEPIRIIQGLAQKSVLV